MDHHSTELYQDSWFKEDLLLDPMELEKTWALRRVLADTGPERAMQSVLNGMKKIKTNPAFLLSLDLKNM